MRACQRKCSLVCEAVQDTPVARVFRDDSVIVLLIEVETGLVSAQKIDLEFHAFDFDGDLRGRALQNPAAQLQSLCFTNRGVVSFDDGDVAEQIDHCSSDEILSHVHPKRERLQNEMIAITIDDHARQTVAFAPHNTAQFRIDISPVAVLGSLRNPAPKEIRI